MSGRDEMKAAFLAGLGWGEATRSPLAGDASFRRYERLSGKNGSAMLMDAPPPKENVRPFLHIARHLKGLGYSAPAILGTDEEAGFLLLEDLGDDTFTRLLAKGEDETALYRLAVDLLIDLHQRGVAAIPSGLAPYDDAKLLDEAALLVEWYLPEVTRQPTPPTLIDEYRALWAAHLPLARGVPDTLVMRDFHVDNLMRLDRPGLAACGLLDFQDAVAGPVTYDPMSLLEDARRDIAPDLVAALHARYLDAFPSLSAQAFDASWAFLAAQRHAKVIGIFTRLLRRDGKPVYLRHIPRVWRLLEASLRHPDLAEIKQWIDRHIPPSLRQEPKP